jgi:putative FmdB family regulatory protein
MPLLEFRCADCEKTSEVLVLAGDEPDVAACPTCGSRDLSRLLSTFAAHAGPGGARNAEAACGDGPCAMPGMCGPSACGFGEN